MLHIDPTTRDFHFTPEQFRAFEAALEEAEIAPAPRVEPRRAKQFLSKLAQMFLRKKTTL